MVKDLYKYFRVEARELTDAMSQGLLLLDKGGPSKAAVGGLLRLAHTLKGASRAVKQPAIAEQAHAMETVLVRYRESDAPVSREDMAELFTLLDRMTAGHAALQATSSAVANAVPPAAPPSPPIPTPALVPVRAAPPPPIQVPEVPAPAANVSAPQTQEIAETVRVDIRETETLLDGLTEASTRLGAMRRHATALDQAHALARAIIEQSSPRAAIAAVNGAPLAGVHGLAEQLKAILDQTMRAFGPTLDGVDAELRQARGRASTLRLMPTSALFAPVERAARDAAQALHKRISFEAAGGDVRVDAHVLTALRAALEHLVRNAVDHGIESPTDRARSKKAPGGRVSLRVERRGSRVCFTCEDDGGGIDIEAVRRAAVSRGIVSEEAAAALSFDEVVRLIFCAGMSTSSKVTEISGRGVGLDVVQELVVRFKGEVRAKTERGVGTTFEITVPVSMSSMTVLAVESDGQTLTFPLDAVKKVVRVAAGDVHSGPTGQTIVVDERVIPFVPLSHALGRAPKTSAPLFWSAIVIETGDARGAIGVERLKGTKEVVVRALPSAGGAVPHVAGASFDDDGDPELLLETVGLLDAARTRGDVARATQTAREPSPILVIDDSVTTRMLEQSILESAGYKVDVASSAIEALVKVRTRKYGLFVCDVEMPGMTGFEFTAHTRKDSVLREIPVILVTSLNSDEDKKRGKDAGCAAYMVKSEFDQARMLRTVRELLR